jgi:hypothetical protein
MKSRYKAYIAISLIATSIMLFTQAWQRILRAFLPKSFVTTSITEIILFVIEILLLTWLGLAGIIVLIKNEKIHASAAQ